MKKPTIASISDRKRDSAQPAKSQVMNETVTVAIVNVNGRKTLIQSIESA